MTRSASGFPSKTHYFGVGVTVGGSTNQVLLRALLT